MARIAIRLSDREHTELGKYARQNKKTMSEYIRLRLFEPETIQEKINFFENMEELNTNIDRLEKQSLILADYLVENQKNMSIMINLIYQFMVAKIGREEAKLLVDKVRKFVETEGKNNAS